jgi:putative solute:sodium symporter small subunit
MSSEASTPTHAALQARLWRRNLRWTLVLLAVWAVVSFGVSAWARELSFTVWGWPFSFWMASQGALLVFCAIVWLHAAAMDRLDAEGDALAEGDAAPR